VQRNISNASTLETLLEVLGFASGRLLDVAGGYGRLCRLLRDKGFDCHTTDKFCQNIFAQDIEPQAGFRADVLFAYEVLEHIESPREFIEDAFHRYGCRNLIFSTMTFAEDVPAPDWWYYSFETGQHIQRLHIADAGCSGSTAGMPSIFSRRQHAHVPGERTAATAAARHLRAQAPRKTRRQAPIQASRHELHILRPFAGKETPENLA